MCPYNLANKKSMYSLSPTKPRTYRQAKNVSTLCSETHASDSISAIHTISHASCPEVVSSATGRPWCSLDSDAPPDSRNILSPEGREKLLTVSCLHAHGGFCASMRRRPEFAHIVPSAVSGVAAALSPTGTTSGLVSNPPCGLLHVPLVLRHSVRNISFPRGIANFRINAGPR